MYTHTSVIHICIRDGVNYTSTLLLMELQLILFLPVGQKRKKVTAKQFYNCLHIIYKSGQSKSALYKHIQEDVAGKSSTLFVSQQTAMDKQTRFTASLIPVLYQLESTVSSDTTPAGISPAFVWFRVSSRHNWPHSCGLSTSRVFLSNQGVMCGKVYYPHRRYQLIFSDFQLDICGDLLC